MHILLGPLKIFEAAARLGSFKAAAEELHLSPSAISHAVAKLEKELGAKLFDRDGRKLMLTLDGRVLHGPIEEAFALIRTGMQSVQSRHAQMLRLHSAPSFAAQWLTPRLQDFLSRHPGMEVQIAADTDYTRFTNDDFDADIAYGPRAQDGLVTRFLGHEKIVPLCTPDMAQSIKKPADVLNHTLIRSTLKSSSWEEWLRANHIAAPATAGMRFDRSFMAINAAADGLGICLDSTRLAERELKSGRLVEPLAGIAENADDAGHYLVFPQRNADRPAVAAFSAWLSAALDAHAVE
ncbi:LysR substrate-binding domain-containing protein [Sphingobium yanoikuyae]|uniref:LysR substrate-binding domain-containing protein n=1 Tax=Sphingobium yanoikuyae TaxID=13690 RepID=UPI00345EFB71